MQALHASSRCAAPFSGARPTCPQHVNVHGIAALTFLAQRQPRVCVSARKRQYQDFGSVDSLDVDSLDELEGLDKYADFINGQDPGAAANGNGNGAAAGAARTAAARGGKTVAQQAASTPARPASSFAYDDFAFDETWGGNFSGGGYVNGGGGGGYMNGSGGSGGKYYGNGSYGSGDYGYVNGNGALLDNYYGGGGGYVNGGNYGNYGRNTRAARGKRNMGFDELMDDPDEIDGEKVVTKVDKCVINGKTLQCNHGITVPQVFLLGAGADRTPLGTMPTSRAQALADEAKEDLLLINPDASPPVARIIDWSKYKYELEKNAKEKKAKSTNVETKEVRLRPSTDSGDIAVKLKSCSKFLSKGDRVKLVMKFEGRELQFKEQGKEVLLNFISELASVAKVEGPLNFKTGTYTIMLAPNKA